MADYINYNNFFSWDFNVTVNLFRYTYKTLWMCIELHFYKSLHKIYFPFLRNSCLFPAMLFSSRLGSSVNICVSPIDLFGILRHLSASDTLCVLWAVAYGEECAAAWQTRTAPFPTFINGTVTAVLFFFFWGTNSWLHLQIWLPVPQSSFQPVLLRDWHAHVIRAEF